jgi:endonuclease III-like uncharacterized protein
MSNGSSSSRFFFSGKNRSESQAEDDRSLTKRELEPEVPVGTKMAPLEISESSDEENNAHDKARVKEKSSINDNVSIICSPETEVSSASLIQKSLQEESQVHTEKSREQTITSTKAQNPFACFAFQATSSLPPPKKKARPTNWVMPEIKAAAKCKPSSNKECEWVKLKDLPAEDQQRVTKKWQSMADPHASLEVRRFQVLVAARLHARCQEPSVRKAMASLREALVELSVDEVAEADPEGLAQLITNLQFYNAKAKQIVKAAQEVKSRFGGVVPEDEHSLLQITGIGKIFADLLAFVNTRSAYIEETSNP